MSCLHLSQFSFLVLSYLSMFETACAMVKVKELVRVKDLMRVSKTSSSQYKRKGGKILFQGFVMFENVYSISFLLRRWQLFSFHTVVH